MKHNWQNYGDASPDHRQIWISGDSRDDYASCVEMLSGQDVSLAENQYRIESGSIYLGGDWSGPMSCCGWDKIGPPEFLEIAEMVNAYQGFDPDVFGFDIVQIGAKPNDWNASGSTCADPTVLHGNTSIERYLRDAWLS